jgi:hypothetical protein
MITTEDVLVKFSEVLGELPDSEAKQWCLDNPPDDVHATRTLLSYLIALDLAA